MTRTIPVDDLPRTKHRRELDERTEFDHQCAVIQWANLMVKTGKYPDLDMLFAVPNSGNQSKATTAKHKAAGLKSGVPDLLLPVRRCGHVGLAIEMKRGANTLSDNQKWWLAKLVEHGWITAVCWTAEQAIETLEDYICGRNERLRSTKRSGT